MSTDDIITNIKREIMKYKKIINLLNNTNNQPQKLKTKNALR